MNFAKGIYLLAAVCSTLILGMDSTPEYVRLKESIRNLQEGDDVGDIFLEACELGYIDLVSTLLDRPETEQHLSEGLTEACRSENTKLMELLMPGIELDPTIMWKCMNRAVGQGNNEMLASLLSYENTDLVEYATGEVLMATLRAENYHSRMGIIQMLLAHASEDCVSQAWNHAIGKGNNPVELVRILLAYPGTSPSAQHYMDLFKDACVADDVDVIKSMVETADVIPSVYVDIELVCRLGRKDVAQVLLDAPHVHFTEKHVEVAAENGHVELVGLLLEKLPNINLRNVLATAVDFYQHDVVKFVLSTELAADAVNATLLKACRMKSASIAKIILQDRRCDPLSLSEPADLEFVQNLSETSKLGGEYLLLNDACAIGNIDVLETPGSELASYAGPCFKIACKNGHSEIARLILKKNLLYYGALWRLLDELKENPKAARTLFSVAGEINSEFKDKLFLKLLTFGQLDLLESENEYLSAEKINDLVQMAKDDGLYRAYIALLEVPGCNQILDLDYLPNLTPLVENIVLFRSGRLEKLPKVMSSNDLDILFLYAPKMIFKPQLAYFKYCHNFIFLGQSCNYLSGSKQCRSIIEKYFWPVVDSLEYFVAKMRPMKNGPMQSVISHLFHQKRSGSNDQELHLMIDGIQDIDFN